MGRNHVAKLWRFTFASTLASTSSQGFTGAVSVGITYKRHILKGLRVWVGAARMALSHKPFLHKDFNTCGKAMKRLYKKPSQNADPSYHSGPRPDKEDAAPEAPRLTSRAAFPYTRPFPVAPIHKVLPRAPGRLKR